ncbi:hypothetical protein [Winogradskya consettensis]|uniref:hypothetical protein n=1 Tax=Winogradskya consettensis TaxID=113560 RepID=UPI001BB4492E|nr:hypothetical protein [Actinoplanes consettensis]
MRRPRAVPLLAALTLVLSFAVAGGGSPAEAAAATPVAGQYVPLTPARIVNLQPVAGAATYSFSPLGKGGVPASGVSAIAYQLHALSATGNGTVTAFPAVAGSSPPGTSNLNFVKDVWADNAVVTKLGTGGQISLYNGSTTAAEADVNVDVVGYYTAAGSSTVGSTYVPLKPVRIVSEKPNAAAAYYDVTPLGQGGVPHSGVTAVVAHVTTTASTAGTLLAFPLGATHPTASDNHYATGGRFTAQTTVKLGTNGTFRIYTTTAVTLWVEIVGYFQDSTGSATGSVFTAVTPARVLGRPVITADTTSTFALAGLGGVPATGSSAVAFNLTAYSESGTLAGGISVYAADEAQPVARQLSYQASTRRWPTQQVSHLSQDGKVAIHNTAAGSVVLLIDVLGYYTPTGLRASGLPWSSGVNPQSQTTERADDFADFRGAKVDNVTLFPRRDNWDTVDDAQWIEDGLPSGFTPARDDLIMTIPLWPGGGVNNAKFTGTQTQWQDLARTIAHADPDAYVRLGWEMNLPNWYWKLTKDNQADWQASFIQAVQWMKAAAPGLRIVYNPNKGADQTCDNECSVQVFEAVRDYVDVYAIDSYDSWNPDTGTAGTDEHFNGYRRLNESLALATANGTKFAVAEWGVACNIYNADPNLNCQWYGHAGGDNPQYIHDYMGWFADNAGDLAYESYFDEPGAYIRSSLSDTPIGPLAPAAYKAEIAANKM